MKVIFAVSNNINQLGLTPENKADEAIIRVLFGALQDPKQMIATIQKAQFFECAGGYIRGQEYQSSEKDCIIVFQEQETPKNGS